MKKKSEKITVRNGILRRSTKVGSTVNHRFYNTSDKRKRASVVQHKDGHLNVVDRRWREHYDGKDWMKAYRAVRKLLGK